MKKLIVIEIVVLLGCIVYDLADRVDSANRSVMPVVASAPRRAYVYWDNPLAVTNPSLLAHYIAMSKPPYADPQPGDMWWCHGTPQLPQCQLPPQVWE